MDLSNQEVIGELAREVSENFRDSPLGILDDEGSRKDSEHGQRSQPKSLPETQRLDSKAWGCRLLDHTARAQSSRAGDGEEGRVQERGG